MTESAGESLPQVPLRRILFLWGRIFYLAAKKIRVGAVKWGTIVRFRGEWGVLEGLRFYSWEGPAYMLKSDDLVEVLKK